MRRCLKPPFSSSECPPQIATTTTTTTTIDDLPEGILSHIISFLPVVDAVNTSPVSSKWRRLWVSSPILHLCILDYAYRFNNFTSRSEIRQRFAIFASQVINHRVSLSPLHKFQLSFECKVDLHRKAVHFWILYALRSKCKILLLNLSNDGYGYGLPSSDDDDDDDDDDEDGDDYCIYPFKFSSLINSSVEELKLQGCKFRSPSASITSLKSLHLLNYEFEMDESNLTELIPLCVNLELLTIEGTGGWHNLYISSSSLKEVNLSLVYGNRWVENSVEIHAPSLRSVSFEHVYVGKCIIQDANSLVEARVLFPLKDRKTFHCWSHLIAALTGVERLTVENMWYLYKFDQLDDPEETTSLDDPETDSDTESIGIKYSGKVSISKKIFSEDFAFNNLKYLKLLTGYEKRDVLGLGLCLEMCPKLEILVLENLYEEDDDDDLIEMSKSMPIIMKIPKLRQVSLMEYKGSKNEVHVVGLLKKHKVVLENITAFPAEENKKPIILWTSSSVCRNVTRSSKAIMG